MKEKINKEKETIKRKNAAKIKNKISKKKVLIFSKLYRSEIRDFIKTELFLIPGSDKDERSTLTLYTVGKRGDTFLL
jgi:hypothetical protein